MDALNGVSVGAHAVIIKHAHTEDTGARSDTHRHTCGVILEIIPDNARHVRAMAIAIPAQQMICPTVSVILHNRVLVFSCVGTGTGSIADEVNLAKEMPVDCGAKFTLHFRRKVDAAIDHRHCNALPGVLPAIRCTDAGMQEIRTHVDSHRVHHFPFLPFISGLDVRLAVPFIGQRPKGNRCLGTST